MNYYQTLINDLGLRLEIPELRLEDDGAVHLGFDGDLAVMIDQDPRFDGLVFSAAVGTVPENNPEFVENLLVSNLFWQNTAGATLGLDPETRRAILAQVIPAGRLHSVEALEAELTEFVATASRWQEAIVRLAEVTAGVGA
jgi:hypothetical protein